MKSIALLYASEGTGHKSAAENLRDWFLIENPDGRVMCRDVLDYIPSWMHAIFTNGYLAMARHAPWLWGWFYWGSDKKSVAASAFDRTHELLCRVYLPRIEKDLYANGTEAVFITHYFGAAPLARRNAAKFPVFYVNTDFITHRFQRDPVFRASFVASPDAVRQYNNDGITDVCDTGIPIAPKYASLPSKLDARAKLGLDAAKPTILVSGGGIGAGSITEAVKSLAARIDWQTVVLCGNNVKLCSRLAHEYSGKDNVAVKRFVSDMENYYAAADAAVMKPGGLSLSEAASAKLPLLLMDPIPGQEQLNMDCLCSLGTAKKLRDASRSAEEVDKLLNSDSSGMAAKLESIARPYAAREILRIAEKIV